MHIVYILYIFAVISYRLKLNLQYLSSFLDHKHIILEFATLDLDISAACIKGKKLTAILAIHMFC